MIDGMVSHPFLEDGESLRGRGNLPWRNLHEKWKHIVVASVVRKLNMERRRGDAGFPRVGKHQSSACLLLNFIPFLPALLCIIRGRGHCWATLPRPPFQLASSEILPSEGLVSPEGQHRGRSSSLIWFLERAGGSSTAAPASVPVEVPALTERRTCGRSGTTAASSVKAQQQGQARAPQSRSVGAPDLWVSTFFLLALPALPPPM